MNKYFIIGFILLLITSITQLFYTTNKMITIGVTIISLAIVAMLAFMYIKKEDKNE